MLQSKSEADKALKASPVLIKQKSVNLYDSVNKIPSKFDDAEVKDDSRGRKIKEEVDSEEEEDDVTKVKDEVDSEEDEDDEAEDEGEDAEEVEDEEESEDGEEVEDEEASENEEEEESDERMVVSKPTNGVKVSAVLISQFQTYFLLCYCF